MKYIATDLDRTLLSNGNHTVSDGAYTLFKKLLKKHKLGLIFVTGRPKHLIEDAFKHYDIPKPSYCIAMVGTQIYEVKKNKLTLWKPWQDYLVRTRKKFDEDKIQALLDQYEHPLHAKQFLNEFKVSYYVPNRKRTKLMEKKLARHGIHPEYIYSYDVNRKVGMFDVLHPNASKLKALNFLLKHLKVKHKDVLYAGDSGNDQVIFNSPINSVLVKNASQEFKEEIMSSLKPKEKDVYIAQGNFKVGNTKLNGNYVAGIIEGAFHYGFMH